MNIKFAEGRVTIPRNDTVVYDFISIANVESFPVIRSVSSSSYVSSGKKNSKFNDRRVKSI